jgi:hypothetical protein
MNRRSTSAGIYVSQICDNRIGDMVCPLIMRPVDMLGFEAMFLGHIDGRD